MEWNLLKILFQCKFWMYLCVRDKEGYKVDNENINICCLGPAPYFCFTHKNYSIQKLQHIHK